MLQASSEIDEGTDQDEGSDWSDDKCYSQPQTTYEYNYESGRHWPPAHVENDVHDKDEYVDGSDCSNNEDRGQPLTSNACDYDSGCRPSPAYIPGSDKSGTRDVWTPVGTGNPFVGLFKRRIMKYG